MKSVAKAELQVGSPAFQVVVVDPPWEQGGINGKGLPYPTMDLERIAAVPVSELLAREGYLFCWATNKFLPACFQLVIGAWGLAYRQTLAWRKRGRCALGGMFATDLEYCVIAQKIGPRTHAHGARTKRERFPSSLLEFPVRGHSEKPREFMELIERVAPGPYLEIFSRDPCPGWTAIGNEVDGVDVAVSAGRLVAEILKGRPRRGRGFVDYPGK